MNPNELILYVLDGNHGDTKTTIEKVNEMVTDLLDENPTSQWGNALAEELEDFASRNDRCPICGAKTDCQGENEKCSECDFEVNYGR